jgi:hypothetical protein
MNTQPTPETDSAYIQRPNEGAWDFRVRQEKTMEKLERERDEAREQRDRLAEALQKVVTAWDFAEWLDENDFESFREALQSLTPNAEP